jgi:DNA primase
MTALEYFKAHGLTQQTIEQFGITYNKEKITIPIKDEYGAFLHNKYRHLDFDKNNPETKKFSYDAGSHAALFNAQILKDAEYVFLVEGEPDCMRLAQEGINAISNTSGAGTFKEEWLEFFQKKTVYVLYDNDKAGQDGMDKFMDLMPTAIRITLPEQYKDVCDYLLENSISDFKKIVTQQREEQKMTYEKLCKVIDKWLLLEDKHVIKVFLASLISHFLTSDPLWVLFVAPPSGSKTEILSTASELPFIKMLSDLTPQTFISGMQGKPGSDPSLLLQLTNHVLIMKDFTTVLNMRQDDKQMILAQLREIYDGKYSKAFGTGKEVNWEGRITLLAGVTPYIDTQSNLFQIMGERFILYRIPQPPGHEMAMKAIKTTGNEKQMRKELKEAFAKYFQSIVIPHLSEMEVPEEIQHSLAYLASFIVQARSGIIRDSYRKEIEFIPDTEAPTRLTRQLLTLMQSLAIEEGRRKIEWKDYYMVLKAALDIIPSNRMKHLMALCGKLGRQSTHDVAQTTKYSPSGAGLLLEDLTALNLATVIHGGQGNTNEYALSALTKVCFHKILPYPTESIDEVFPKNSIYSDIIAEMLDTENMTTEEVEEKTWQKTKLF